MSPQPTIAACLIVKGTKDEAPLLAKALGSINGYVDTIYLNINVPKGVKIAPEIIKVAEQFSAVYIKSTWTGNFVKSRTDSFAMAKTEDFVMWMDCDDTIDRPQEIRNIIAILSKQRQGIYVKYDYDHDEYGNTTVSHWVARIVRNNGSYKWQSSISDEDVAVHETLVEVIPRPKALCDDFKVIHHADTKRRDDSLVRNINLLQSMYSKQEQKGEYDPRTLFYLATHYYDAGNYRTAVGLLQDYLMMSGWPEERCEAHVYLGNIYQKFGQDDHAQEEYIRGLSEYQNSPRPYIELSQLAYETGRYQDSADWIEKCLQLPPPATTMVQRPMETSFRAYLLAAQAYINLGGNKLDLAKKHIDKALHLRPLDPDAQRARDMLDELITKREDIRAALRIVRKFEDEDKTKVLPFINSLPDTVQDNPLILNARHANTEPKVWGKKSIAIYVGQGPLGIWGPWSLKSGIGGSEEAVIRLSRELAELGWNVHIYATPGDHLKDTHGWDTYRPGNIALQEGGSSDGSDYNAPAWHQYYEFNPKDEYNVLIAWRNPAFFDADIKAKKRYLWLHDVMDKEEFLPERLDRIDKVIFVGQYHANLYDGVIPKEKWFISGNGIDAQDFIDADGKYKRKPHNMIYMSAYNRGLKILLDNWNTIKDAVPDATLDIYYGWESYDAINKDNPERMQWKSKLVKQIASLNGVTDHGRIGQDEIVKVINKAEVLAYPCIFPEVYAISYVKAVAGGAFPVTSDYAELGNYKAGAIFPYEPGKLDEFVEGYVSLLVTVLQDYHDKDDWRVFQESKNTSMQRFRDTYSWENTAKAWDEEFSNE